MLRTSLVLGLLVAALPCQGSRPAERALRVLFLGDRGHHEPALRAQQVLAPLRRAGIDLFYRESLAELAPETLRAFDAVLIYANWPRITQAQETALVQYVRGGGALVAVHCASYCFLNSDRYVELVGARFKSHGFGKVAVTTPSREHPAIAGVPDFESEDETYVHERHGSDRTILQTRPEGSAAEPWTWVRSEGKGRVFYTAWGHDQRTWGNPGFQKLLVRGIAWASGHDATSLWQPQPAAVDEVKAPFYEPAGKVRGGAHVLAMERPFDPAREHERLVVPPGLRTELFASEPSLTKPIALAFDERGRAFVAETVDYPNDLQPQGQGHDRITICEDTDGDGKADRFTVFADKLSIPTGLAFANGGLIVTQAPDVLFLRDRDGDGKADERRVLFTGFHTGDTHAGPSHVRIGFDGWVWGTVGYSGFDGEVGGKRHRFSQGIFRFKPDGSELEFVASTDNNTWGLGISEEGDVFASTANGNPSVHLVVPNRAVEAVPGLSAGVLPRIAETTVFHPITESVRQVDYHGAYTAAAGHTLYTARTLPRRYWGRSAFVCEPTGHLVGLFELEQSGASFVARDRWTLLASDDAWCAPVATEVGPDGAVWLLDWYAFIVQHNPTPPGYATGKGNAYVTPLRDKTHGRIWRIVPTEGAPGAVRDLGKMDTAELVATLRDPNLFWRMHAQRLLVERAAKDARAALVALLADPALDALGNAPAALHSLWTLHGLGALDADVALAALSHPAPAVRRAALQVAPRDAVTRDAIVAKRLLADPDGRVVVQALLALGEMPSDPALGATLHALVTEHDLQKERPFALAASCAIARHAAGYLGAALRAVPATGAGVGVGAPATRNLIANPSFEDEASGREAPALWQGVTYSGTAKLGHADRARDGQRSVSIASEAGADASWSQKVAVRPGTRYRLAAFVRTEGVKSVRGGLGALLNVHELQGGDATVRTKALVDTQDWTELAVEFDSAERQELTINCLFGGWGQATGQAWFDEVRLVELASDALSGRAGRLAALATRALAASGDGAQLDALWPTLASAEPAVVTAVLDGIANGWPAERVPRLSEAATRAIAALAESPARGVRVALLRLLALWQAGDRVPAERRAALARELVTEVADPKAEREARIAAARALLAVADAKAAATTVLAQLDLDSDPALAEGLLEALTLRDDPEIGKLLLAKHGSLSPGARARAVAALLRRPSWSFALLDAVAAGSLDKNALAAQNWLALEQHPDTTIRERARAVHQGTRSDRRATIEPFLVAATRAGDRKRGREVFTANCVQCHRFDGPGGELGPSLAGIGKRPKADILVDVLDPNRSIETNYRLWTVKTKEGEVLAGRLVSESKTAIEILDLAGVRHEVERKQIEALQLAPVSAMPEGFERLGVEDLASLLEYLAADPKR